MFVVEQKQSHMCSVAAVRQRGAGMRNVIIWEKVSIGMWPKGCLTLPKVRGWFVCY